MRRSLAWALAGLLVAACAAPVAPTSSPGPGGPSNAPSAPPSSESVAATVMPTVEPATPAPTGPVLPTTEPTGPSWTPRPAERLLLDSLVYVQVDRLNVREMPTVNAKILDVVEQGDFLRIADYGPFSHDGYTWYWTVFLAKAGEPPVSSTVNVRDSDGVRGWIAVGQGDASYVKRLKPRCPPVIDLASIEHMLGSELLACFGGNSIELVGTFGCSGCGGARPGTFEPDWLANPLNFSFLTEYPVTDRLGPFVLHFPPSGPAAPPVASVIRVRGHFDDAAAETCTISVIDPLKPFGDDLIEISAAAAHLACAQQFVVESVEVLGTDPGFIFG